MKSEYGKITPLRLLCLKHKTSRQQLAKDAGISVRTLYNFEGGEPIADETILKIANALGADPVYVAAVLTGEIKLEMEIRAVAA